MKRKLRIILAVALSVMLLVTAAVPAFAKPMDTTGHWAENLINKWVDNGWIKGYSDGSFKPDNLMLKAEFAALTNRSLGFSTEADISALDVSVNDWFYGDMAKAVAAGYMTVPANGYMKPKALVSREDVAVMVAKMLGLDLPDTNEELDRFTDADDISSDNKAAVSAVVGKGIMQGFGSTFEPDEFLSRAQGVTILDRIRNLLDDGSIQMTASLEDELVAAAGGSPAGNPIVYPGGGPITNPGTTPETPPSTEFTIRLDELSYDMEDPASTTCAALNVGFALLNGKHGFDGLGVSLYDFEGNLMYTMAANSGLLNRLTGGTNLLDCLFEDSSLSPTGAPATMAALSEAEAATLLESDWAVEYSWDEPMQLPSKIIIEVTDGDDVQYSFDSQDKVYVDDDWTDKTWYENVGDNKLFGLNAFYDIQDGITAVNERDQVESEQTEKGQVLVAPGVYEIIPNDYTYYYGVVINKSISLLGAQAGVVPEEGKIREGGESVLYYAESDTDENGGGAITLLKNSGSVIIDGFTFMYNELGIDMSVYDAYQDYTETNDSGIIIRNNRFIDNFIDVLLDNSDGMISNYAFENNIFGMGEVKKGQYVLWTGLMDIVRSMHNPLQEAAENASDGAFLEIDMCVGAILMNPVGLQFTGNTVYGKTIGLGILGTTTTGSSATENYFHGNTIGFGLYDPSNTLVNYPLDINYNRILHNTLGVAQLNTGKINATKNWWGSEDWADVKPQILSQVSYADESTMVEYFPWALNGECSVFANDDLTGFVVNAEWDGGVTGKSMYLDGLNYILGVNAFSSIQGAIEAASQNYLSGANGDWWTVINVVPGIYKEELMIPSPMKIQKLSGYGSSEVIVDAPVWIPGEYVEFLNMTMGEGQCIEIDSLDEVTVKGNKLDKGAIIFYEIPDKINGTDQAAITEAMISAANNGAKVRFSANYIDSFEVEGQAGLTVINYNTSSIYFRMPYSADPDYTLTPDIEISRKATINPASGVEQDFAGPVTYQVTAGDGTTRDYMVYLQVDAPITAYAANGELYNQVGASVIDEINRTISFHMPYETADLRLGNQAVTITPSIIASGDATVYLGDKATIASTTPVSVDFTIDSLTRSGSLSYFVKTDPDSDPADPDNYQEWIVTCIVDLNDDNDILDFYVSGQEGNTFIDSDNHYVEFRLVNASEDTLSSLVPVITLPEEATYRTSDTNADGSVYFFDQYVTYYVTAQDGTVQEWDVVCYTTSALNDIASFSVAGQVGASDINTDTHTVTFTMPYGSNVSALYPNVDVSPFASAMYPLNGTPLNFTSGTVAYTVTAQDTDYVQTWTVKCLIEAPKTDAEILTFVAAGAGESTIVSNTTTGSITFSVPYGTTPSGITVNFTLSDGATAVAKAPATSTGTLDFSGGDVVFVVTAQDGITAKEWTIKLIELPPLP